MWRTSLLFPLWLVEREFDNAAGRVRSGACMVPLGSAQWGYAVHPELGMSALRRDERTEAINNTAARNALVTGVLVLTAATVYYGHLRSALFLLPS